MLLLGAVRLRLPPVSAWPLSHSWLSLHGRLPYVMGPALWTEALRVNIEPEIGDLLAACFHVASTSFYRVKQTF